MFPINTTLAEGTILFFKNSEVFMVIENLYGDINVTSGHKDCEHVLNDLYLSEAMNIQYVRNLYFELYKNEEHEIYFIEA